MAGKKAQGNQHRKRKFDDYRKNDVAQRNKERKWKARVRKLESKALKRGDTDYSYPFNSLKTEQEHSMKDAEKGKRMQAERRFDERQKKLGRKKKQDHSVD